MHVSMHQLFSLVQDGTFLPTQDSSLYPTRGVCCFCHIKYPLFTSLVHSRWLDVGLAHLYMVMNLIVSIVYKQVKKNSANI